MPGQLFPFCSIALTGLRQRLETSYHNIDTNFRLLTDKGKMLTVGASETAGRTTRPGSSGAQLQRIRGISRSRK